jgi:hypothetical protein
MAGLLNFPEGAAFGTGSPAETAQQPAGLGSLLRGAYEALGLLSKRAIGSSEMMRTQGMYDPAPMVEAAMLPMGTGAVAGVKMAPGEMALGAGPIRAYHGSPHDFDRFDLSKARTGDGTAAFGEGAYFAENEAVARAYRDTLSRDKPGSMYEVNINADPAHFLDWDKPLSAGSPKQIQDAFNQIANSRPEIKERFYEAFRNQEPGWKYYSILSDAAKTGDIVKNQTAATTAFREAGIPGIKYLDQGSRGAGQGSSNYVVFDDKLIDILKKYGLAGLAAPPAFAGAMDNRQ